MLWFLLLWLIAPPIELIVIGILAYQNRKYRDLLKKGGWKPGAPWPRTRESQGGAPQPASVPQSVSSPQPAPVLQSVSASQPAPKPEARRPLEKGRVRMAALIIGMVFVVLAGILFATTTWRIMPDFGKVGMVFACSVLFFGTSRIAERILKIHRTGNALYLLGSVFLFLTVLAAGYFRILGPYFILEGVNRWRVLWVGSLVMEGALLAGVKRFHDKGYNQACLWGVTVSMLFFMASLKVGWIDFGSCMMIYGAVLLIVSGVLLSRMSKAANSTAGSAAEFHVPGACAAEGYAPGPSLAQALKTFAPAHFLVLYLVTMWNSFCGMCKSLALDGLPGGWGSPFLQILALAAAIAGLAWLVRIQKARTGEKARPFPLNWLLSLTAALLIHYGCFAWGNDYPWLTLAVMLTVLCFVGGRRIGPLKAWTGFNGDMVYAIVLCLDALPFLPAALFADAQNNLLAMAAMAATGLAVMEWGQSCPRVKVLLPVIGWLETSYLYAACSQVQSAGGTWLPKALGYDCFLFVYLAFLAMFSLHSLKKGHMEYEPGFLFLTTIAGVVTLWEEEPALPFFLLAAGYLALVKRSGCDLFGWREQVSEGGILGYTLAGVYSLMAWVTTDPFSRLMALNLVFGLWRTARGLCRKEEHTVWDLTSCLLCGATLLAFYLADEEAWWNMGLCMAVYGIHSLLLYRSRRNVLALVTALMALPFPEAVRFSFGIESAWAWGLAEAGLTDGKILGATAIILLASGLAARARTPVAVPDPGCSLGWRADWHHMAAGLLILWYAVTENAQWRFVYTALLALYVLQYATLPKLFQASLTLSGAVAVAAFWIQPLLRWPSVMETELCLLPAALYAFLLGRIWGKRTGVKGFQSLIWLVCLGILTIEAYETGKAVDAIMLEVICLLIFVIAQMRRHLYWSRIGGGLAVGIALYMTKTLWLSIAWWVYLLAAGIGLIAFAAAGEMKKKK